MAQCIFALYFGQVTAGITLHY